MSKLCCCVVSSHLQTQPLCSTPNTTVIISVSLDEQVVLLRRFFPPTNTATLFNTQHYRHHLSHSVQHPTLPSSSHCHLMSKLCCCVVSSRLQTQSLCSTPNTTVIISLSLDEQVVLLRRFLPPTNTVTLFNTQHYRHHLRVTR